MNTSPATDSRPLTEAIFADARRAIFCQTDRLFRWLLVAQWLFGITLALAISPWSWIGDQRVVHVHVWSAVVLGGALCAPALVLIARRPGWVVTRHVVAATQMSFSALLIHLTGGRIETHFHVFGSLAFIAFYRDRTLLGTATIMVTVDHVLRGLLWPESVYGIVNPEWWRFLEHAGWVVFEDVVLFAGIVRAHADLRRIATREASLTEINTTIEQEVVDRTAELAASRERYQALVERSQAVIWELRPDEGRCCYVAPQVQRLLGHSLARFGEVGFLYSIIHADDYARVIAGIARASADGLDYQEELRFVAADDRVVHIRCMVAVDRGPLGTILRCVGLDITAQKQLESELREAQKVESLTRMAHEVAHEINAPLQYIGNDAEFLGSLASRLVADMRTIGALEGTSSFAAHERAVEIVRRAKVAQLERRVPEAVASINGGIRAVERIVAALGTITGGSSPEASGETDRRPAA